MTVINKLTRLPLWLAVTAATILISGNAFGQSLGGGLFGPTNTVRSFAGSPATCKTTSGNIVLNTSTGVLGWCSALNTWSYPTVGGYVPGGTDVAVVDGGTGLSTLTANNVILGNGTGTPLFVAPGTSGNVLTSNGTTWTSAAAAGGSLTSQTLTTGQLTAASNAVRAVTVSTFTFNTALVQSLGAVTSGDLLVATLPARTVVTNVYVRSASMSWDGETATLAVGRTGADYIDYIVATNAVSNTTYGDTSGERGTNLTGYDLPSWTATTDVFIRFVMTGSTLASAVASGTVVIEHYTIP